MRILLFCLLALCGVACSDIPSDPGQSLSRIKASGVLDVGIVSGAERTISSSFLQSLENATAAKASSRSGEAEELLYELESGQLDLVIGSFAKSSPWHRNVWLSSAIEKHSSGSEVVLRAAARTGENEWIMLIENVVRQQ